MTALAPYLLAAVILLAEHLKARAADARHTNLLASQSAERLAWTHERQELLNRVQAPGLVPVGVPGLQPEAETQEPPEKDEWDLVGQTLRVPDEAIT